ncbi:MAG: hypothetical protein U0736_24550 [Gemmataceae bacterium]
MSDAPAPRPKRTLLRRVRLPRLSGKVSAFWLVCCFALTAALIPMALHLPRWVEFEIVLAAWWVIWLIVLTWLLYTRQRVTDDHTLREPRNWLSGMGEVNPLANYPSGNPYYWGSFDVVEAEGCLYILGFLLALVALFFVAWFVVEVAVPLVLFVMYFVTRGMLAAVINDRHHCTGRLARSFGWAMLWATAYTAPLALVVWTVHYFHQRPLMGG